MQNIKKLLGVIVVAGALTVLVYTLHTSVFYAASSDSGPANVSTSVADANTTTSLVTVSSTTSEATSTKNKDIVELPKASSDLPSRLLIPSLKIDANVQYVQVNDKGNMGTPKGFTDVAWYKPGVIPGQIGSAVMAGHVDNAIALDGVFKHLGDMKAGDDVYVQDKSGKKIHFVVNEVKLYPYQEVPAALIFGQRDISRLNLISCAGIWLKDLKTYDERLVVFTSLVN